MELARNPQVLAGIGGWLALFLAGAASVLKSRTALQLENVAPRHLISPSTLREEMPALHEATNFCTSGCAVWADWRLSLVIVKPDTIVAVHRAAMLARYAPSREREHGTGWFLRTKGSPSIDKSAAQIPVVAAA